MGTVPSSIQADPHQPRLGVKVLPAALICSGSFSRWVLLRTEVDLTAIPAGASVRWITALTKGDAALCSTRGASARQPGHKEEEEAEEMPPSSMAGLVPPYLGI